MMTRIGKDENDGRGEAPNLGCVVDSNGIGYIDIEGASGEEVPHMRRRREEVFDPQAHVHQYGLVEWSTK